MRDDMFLLQRQLDLDPYVTLPVTLLTSCCVVNSIYGPHGHSVSVCASIESFLAVRAPAVIRQRNSLSLLIFFFHKVKFISLYLF